MNDHLRTTLRQLRLSGLASSLDVRLQEAQGIRLTSRPAVRKRLRTYLRKCDWPGSPFFVIYGAQNVSGDGPRRGGDPEAGAGDLKAAGINAHYCAPLKPHTSGPRGDAASKKWLHCHLMRAP